MTLDYHFIDYCSQNITKFTVTLAADSSTTFRHLLQSLLQYHPVPVVAGRIFDLDQKVEDVVLPGKSIVIRALQQVKQSNKQIFELAELMKYLNLPYRAPKTIFQQDDFKEKTKQMADQQRRQYCATLYRQIFGMIRQPLKNFSSWELLNNYNFKDNRSTKLELPNQLRVELVSPANQRFESSLVWNVLAANLTIECISFKWISNQPTILGTVVLRNNTRQNMKVYLNSGTLWSYRASKSRLDCQDVVSNSNQFQIMGFQQRAFQMKGFCANKLTKGPDGSEQLYDLSPWLLHGFKEGMKQSDVWSLSG